MQARLLAYAQYDSPLHRMDARWKLVAIALSCAVVVALRTPWAAAAALAGALFLLALGGLPARWYLGRLSGIALFLAVFLIGLPLTMPGSDLAVGPLRLSRAGLDLALLIGLKALTVVALTLLLLATTPFDHLLKAAHALHLPNLLIQLLLLTYRYIFLFWDELDKLRIALRVRGFRNRAAIRSYQTIGQVTGTLLVRSYERAERVGQAMRCRGFAGRFQALVRFQTRWSDLLQFLLIVGILILGPGLLDLGSWTGASRRT